MRKKKKAPGSRVHVQDEIRNEHLSNTSQKHNRFAQLARFLSLFNGICFLSVAESDIVIEDGQHMNLSQRNMAYILFRDSISRSRVPPYRSHMTNPL
jgi:hypothetical protein